MRFRRATIFVNGKRVRRLRGPAVSAPIVLRHLPSGAFTLKVVATTTRGQRLVTRRRYEGCRRCSKTSRLVVRLPHSKQPVIKAALYLNGHRVKVARGSRSFF